MTTLRSVTAQPVFRFAPSPTGYLHRGHALSALLNADLARRHGGRLLLRIEDIDPLRREDRHVAAIVEDLDWLGVRFDQAPVRQSARMPLYRDALDRLAARGLTYLCACTRGEIARTAIGSACDPDGAPLYAGTCREHPPSPDRSCVTRLDIRRALASLPDAGTLDWHSFDPDTGRPAQATIAHPEDWGDVVLARKDTPTSYHLAVTLDDAAQGVTHVVRGADLERATDLHRLLQALLGQPRPLYQHHPLLCDPSGAKLSKSRASTSLRDLRTQGWTAGDVRRELGFP